MRVTEILYKYRPIDEDTLRILTHSEVYFSQPKSFNDPFDCKVHTTVQGSRSDRISFSMKMDRLGHPHWPETKVRQEAERIENQQPNFYRKLRPRLDRIVQEAIENEIRVYCLSKINDSILMWSHYADKHRGICIGFSSDVDGLFGAAREVEYKEEFPTVSHITQDRDEIHRKALLTKAGLWEYEKEWRVVALECHEGVQSFSPQLLKEVVFGCAVESQDRQRVLEAMSEREIRVFEARLKDREYALDVVEIGP